MLNVSDLNVFYGESHTIYDASFTLGDTDALAVIGRNGVGKTTLLKSIMGILPSRSGTVRLNGTVLSNLQSYERVRAGLAFVPQGRLIFPYLTVEENILTGMTHLAKQQIPEYIYTFFPVLKEMRRRRGGNLSGGQQQMLAIARALVSEPKVLILDEPTEGIQPSIIKELAQSLKKLRQELKFAILLSEQVLSFALEVADKFAVLDRGRVVYENERAKVDMDNIKAFLTV
jgi:urea transport system ATP-binding protein